MSDDVLVKVDNVSKRFCRSFKRSLWYGLQDLGSEIGGRSHGGEHGLPQSSADVELRQDEFWAVKDVSFELRRGECLGLIGRNGAGKTTLLRMLNGLIKPDTGRIEMRGRVGALIALGAGFNPVLTGRENIFVAGSVLGFDKAYIHSKLDSIIEFSEITSFIDSPAQSYSSGMQVRLGFAVASAFDPDILILDEVLAVGDRQFSHKCFNRLGEIRDNGAATLLVSHSEHQLSRFCDSGIFLSNGEMAFAGGIVDALSSYSRAAPGQVPKNKKTAINITAIKRKTCTLASLTLGIAISFPEKSLTDVQLRGLLDSGTYWLEIVLRQSDGTIIGYTSSYLARSEMELINASITISCMLSIPHVNSLSLTPSFALWNKKRSCCIATDQGAPTRLEQDIQSLSLLPVIEFSFAKHA